MVLILIALLVTYCVLCALVDTLGAQAEWKMRSLLQTIFNLVWGQTL